MNTIINTEIKSRRIVYGGSYPEHWIYLLTEHPTYYELNNINRPEQLLEELNEKDEQYEIVTLKDLRSKDFDLYAAFFITAQKGNVQKNSDTKSGFAYRYDSCGATMVTSKDTVKSRIELVTTSYKYDVDIFELTEILNRDYIKGVYRRWQQS